MTLAEVRKQLLTGAIILGITIGIPVLAELGLGLAFPEQVETETMLLHPEYTYLLRPNIEARFKRAKVNGGDVITWKSNSRSFRGHELRPNPEVRIVVYGDSNILARFSRLKDTFPAKVESYLSDLSTKDIEVINAGVVGYRPDQSLIRLSREADTIRPDIVVLHVFADNDFGDLVRHRLFDLEAGRLVRRLRRFASSLLITRLALGMTGTAAAPDREENSQESKEDYVARLIDATEKEYLAYRNGVPFLHTDHYDIDIALDPGGDSATTKVALMEAVLAEAQRVANAKGIRLLVLIQPSTIDLTGNLGALDYEHLETYPAYSRKRLSSLVEDICARLGIHSLNLFDVFQENDPETLFFRSDNHWNDAGQDLAARNAAEYIHRAFLEP